MVPELREIGWVSTHSLLPLNPNWDSGVRPLPAVAASPVREAPSPEPDIPSFTPERRQRSGEATAGVKYYFSSSGEWIAFRTSGTDPYLFDRKGNWIGWFP